MFNNSLACWTRLSSCDKKSFQCFCTNQGFIVHSPRLRSLFATRPYSFIKQHAMNLLTCNLNFCVFYLFLLKNTIEFFSSYFFFFYQYILFFVVIFYLCIFIHKILSFAVFVLHIFILCLRLDFCYFYFVIWSLQDKMTIC